MEPFLRANGITKRFGMLTALDDVSLEIYPGEVVGLAGRSGSGKTLLARILAGSVVPDSGEIMVNGRYPSWPFKPKHFDIGLIHQEPQLADQFDITSNIFLGHELTWSFKGRSLRLLNQRKMHETARQILAQLDVNFPTLHEKVGNLSSDDRLLVTMAKGMVSPAKLRIIDDPTAMLSIPYQSKLLSLIETWQQQGIAVLFASQNLDHLFAVTDRIITLRQGKVINTLSTDTTTREEIVAGLIGVEEQREYTPVIWALDSYYKAKEQAERMQHQQLLLEQDLVARDKVNQQLLDRLAEQVRALDSVNLALQDAQRRLLTQRELERKHLARELHDETIQDLLSLNYQLEEIASLAGENETMITELDDLRHHIRYLVANLRGICGNLRPPTIDSLGLGAALTSYALSWQDRTGIELELSLNENFGRLPETIELSIFRIVQEGLNNVGKHSGASKVEVTLTYTSPRMLSIMIVDNGRGLPTDFDMSIMNRSGHYGLLGISERVALLGGRLRIQNQAKGGLAMVAEIPHPRVVMDES